MDNLTFFRTLVAAALPVACQELTGQHPSGIAARAIVLARAVYDAERAVNLEAPEATATTAADPTNPAGGA